MRKFLLNLFILSIILTVLPFSSGASTYTKQLKFAPDSVTLVEDSINGKLVTHVNYAGLENNGEIGMALLPVMYLRVSIPYNVEPKLKSTASLERVAIHYSGEIAKNECVNAGMPEKLKPAQMAEDDMWNYMNGDVIIPSGKKLTIESADSTFISPGVVIEKGGILTIKCNTVVTLEGLTVKKDGKVKIFAQKIDVAGVDDNFVISDYDDVELYENGNRIYPRKTKCLAVQKAKDPEAPMVVEGRTWWYHASSVWQNRDAEYGIGIGKAIEYNGKQWHEIRLKIATEDFANKVWKEESEGFLFGYIRQERNRVFVSLVDSEKWSKCPTVIFQSLRSVLFFNSPIFDTELMVYDMTDDSEPYNCGLYDATTPYTAYNTTFETIENSGDKYFTHVTELFNFGESGGIGLCDKMHVASELGILDHKSSDSDDFNTLNVLFFYPLGGVPSSTLSFKANSLRYVTDGDNNVIYTGDGGVKLWEEYASSADIMADIKAAETTYFNLQGVRVDADNLTPGIYIRRQGNSASKVVVH